MQPVKTDFQAMGGLVRAAIREHFRKTGKKVPTAEQALLWAVTEMAEAVEVLFAQGDWVRNNPEEKPIFDKEALGTELGDAMMMLLLCGYLLESDPLLLMLTKLTRD